MPPTGGIKAQNLHPELLARLLPDLGSGVAANELLQAKIGTRPGVRALNVLNVGADVVNGDVLAVQYVYPGAASYKTFEVDIINTDSAVNTANTAAGALAGTGTHALVTLGGAPATAISVGDVIRIENELLLVMRKLSTLLYVVARAYAGTTIAAHAQDLDVFVSDSVPPANISVPLVTTLTAAAFAAAFVAVFNWAPPAGESAPVRTTPHVGRYTAMPTVGLGAGAEILIVGDDAGVDVTVCSEEFANSTDNVWANAGLVGGVDPGVLAFEVASRVPNATEFLLGEMHFAFPFTVRTVLVTVRVTATGIIKAFLGTVLIGYGESTAAQLASNIVTIRNVGAASTAYAAEFTTTDTVQVHAAE
jgi:hypothetical protein